MGKVTPQPRTKIINAITKAYGFRFDREGGRHSVYVKDGVPEIIAVPRHGEITPTVIRNICRIIGVSTNTFLETLRNC